MKLHDLKPTQGSVTPKRRIGRGIAAGQGKTAGRGTKGAGARGRHARKRQYFEGGQLPLVRRLPFKRGFTNLFRIEYQEVNLDMLAKRFSVGETVSPQTLVDKGLIRDASQPVAILGRGELEMALTIQAHRATKSAVEKITKAGGTLEIMPLLVTGALATIKKLRKEDLAKLGSK